MVANHHRSHAIHGFFDSSFASALVVTWDGGGNDGTVSLWRAATDCSDDGAAFVFEALPVMPIHMPEHNVYTHVGGLSGLHVCAQALPVASRHGGGTLNLGDRYEQLGWRFISEVGDSSLNAVAGKQMGRWAGW